LRKRIEKPVIVVVLMAMQAAMGRRATRKLAQTENSSPFLNMTDIKVKKIP
jgi:hypothetical protein